MLESIGSSTLVTFAEKNRSGVTIMTRDVNTKYIPSFFLYSLVLLLVKILSLLMMRLIVVVRKQDQIILEVILCIHFKVRNHQ